MLNDNERELSIWRFRRFRPLTKTRFWVYHARKRSAIMNLFLVVILAVAALSFSTLAQDGATTMSAGNKKTIVDIKKQIDASPQKKNIAAIFDEKANKSTIAT